MPPRHEPTVSTPAWTLTWASLHECPPSGDSAGHTIQPREGLLWIGPTSWMARAPEAETPNDVRIPADAAWVGCVQPEVHRSTKLRERERSGTIADGLSKLQVLRQTTLALNRTQEVVKAAFEVHALAETLAERVTSSLARERISALSSHFSSGAYRDRTGDLRLAKPALSQLS